MVFRVEKKGLSNCAVCVTDCSHKFNFKKSVVVLSYICDHQLDPPWLSVKYEEESILTFQSWCIIISSELSGGFFLLLNAAELECEVPLSHEAGEVYFLQPDFTPSKSLSCIYNSVKKTDKSTYSNTTHWIQHCLPSIIFPVKSIINSLVCRSPYYHPMTWKSPNNVATTTISTWPGGCTSKSRCQCQSMTQDSRYLFQLLVLVRKY